MGKSIKDTKGGTANIEGIEYQLYVSLYYFLSRDISEIIIEWLDEDIVIVDEEKTMPSLKFVQCKYIGSGSLTFSRFIKNVLPRFIEIFETFKKEDPTTRYSFMVVCNTALDEKLTNLQRASDLLRNGVPVRGIERLYGRTLLSKIKDTVRNSDIDIYSFLRVLFFKPNLTKEEIYNEIRRHLVELGSTNPDNDIKLIIGYLMDKKSGRITKNQLKNDLDLDYSLHKVSELTKAPFPLRATIEDIQKIKSEASRSYSSIIEEMYPKTYDFESIVSLAEVTTNQINEKINLLPKGTVERRELERVSEDTSEIAGSLTEHRKKIRESLKSIESKSQEIMYIRKRYLLDEFDEWEVIE